MHSGEHLFNFRKGNMMNSNQKGDKETLQSTQPPGNRESGSQSNKQSGNQTNQQTGNQANRQSGNQDSNESASGSRAGMQGGTREQHAEAGRQSHKNDPSNKQSATGTGSGSGSSGSAGSKQSGATPTRSVNQEDASRPTQDANRQNKTER
jgi:uncharacterized protein